MDVRLLHQILILLGDKGITVFYAQQKIDMGLIVTEMIMVFVIFKILYSAYKIQS